MTMLESVGIDCAQGHFRLEFSKLVSDAVAKSKVLKQQGHTGYLSCTKCWVYGSYKSNRVFFKETNCLKKRDSEQKAASTSILKTVSSFQFVTKVPLDYMHLVCLGVVKTFLSLLTVSGKRGILRSSQIDAINKRLNEFKKYVPSEFVRRPESLSFLGQWKATQFRQFLLYVGYAAMVNIVQPNVFHVFLRLSIAIRIFCSNRSELFEHAHTQLLHFLEEFGNIFGDEHLSHNFHNLCHLRDDVELHGPLDNFSAFRYENFMQQVLKDIRKPDQILQQIYRRQKEREMVPIDRSKKIVKSIKHNEGPFVEEFSGTQYSRIQYNKFVIDTKKEGDNCFLIDDKVVIAENIIKKNDKYYIIGRKYREKNNLFNTLMDSSLLKMYNCSKLSKKLKIYEIDKVSAKLFRLLLNDASFMVSPLLHFEKNDEY